ncbi:MAG TPA: quinone oxidoreductase [Nitriliruptorales bacterium]|nr:quinone oxidoreductase [Nitriliruptorales bacterium]
MRAVRIHEPGDAGVLRTEQVARPEPGAGQVRVRITAAGVNFIDTYHRRGEYPLDLPTTLGVEGAGVVDAVGPGVDDVHEGDRVAYAMALGSYADAAVVDAWRLVPVPEDVDLRLAAAVLLQGMTAHYLSHSTFALGADHTAVVLAAAGGVGHLLTQIAKLRGARVIATASTAKLDLAREAGADDVIDYTRDGFSDDVRHLTDGRGADVVYDGVGRTTFDDSLDSLRPRGYLVLYGAAAGPVPPLDPQVLNRKGSLFLTRPSLAHYAADRRELRRRAQQLFRWIRDGDLVVRVDRTWPLDQAAEAHRHLEGRRTTGKVLLVPSPHDDR